MGYKTSSNQCSVVIWLGLATGHGRDILIVLITAISIMSLNEEEKNPNF